MIIIMNDLKITLKYWLWWWWWWIWSKCHKIQGTARTLYSKQDVFGVKHETKRKIVRHSPGQSIGGKVLFWGAAGKLSGEMVLHDICVKSSIVIRESGLSFLPKGCGPGCGLEGTRTFKFHQYVLFKSTF